MSESGTPASQSSPGDFDLTQFYQVFFEEAAENLASMENMLLTIDVDDPVEEDLHAIFRAAHSIKGGAATFGFQDVAELTHELETLLDRVRKHELPLTTEIVDTLLEAGDVLKAQLARHQAGDAGEVGDISELLSNVRRLAQGLAATPEAVKPIAKTTPVVAAVASTAAQPVDGVYTYDMEIGPLADATVFDSIVELFADIPNLGSITPDAEFNAAQDDAPPADFPVAKGKASAKGSKTAKSPKETKAAKGAKGTKGTKGTKEPNGTKAEPDAPRGITRRYRVITTSPESELCDLFSFHVSR